MNWIGGTRNRLKQKYEKKLQKEFFERKRFEMRHQTVKRKDKRPLMTLSQDMLTLNSFADVSKQRHSKESTTKNVNLDKSYCDKKGVHKSVILPHSPPETPSLISIMDAKSDRESSKEKAFVQRSFSSTLTSTMQPHSDNDHHSRKKPKMDSLLEMHNKWVSEDFQKTPLRQYNATPKVMEKPHYESDTKTMKKHNCDAKRTEKYQYDTKSTGKQQYDIKTMESPHFTKGMRNQSDSKSLENSHNFTKGIEKSHSNKRYFDLETPTMNTNIEKLRNITKYGTSNHDFVQNDNSTNFSTSTPKLSVGQFFMPTKDENISRINSFATPKNSTTTSSESKLQSDDLHSLNMFPREQLLSNMTPRLGKDNETCLNAPNGTPKGSNMNSNNHTPFIEPSFLSRVAVPIETSFLFRIAEKNTQDNIPLDYSYSNKCSLDEYKPIDYSKRAKHLESNPQTTATNYENFSRKVNQGNVTSEVNKRKHDQISENDVINDQKQEKKNNTDILNSECMIEVSKNEKVCSNNQTPRKQKFTKEDLFQSPKCSKVIVKRSHSKTGFVSVKQMKQNSGKKVRPTDLKKHKEHIDTPMPRKVDLIMTPTRNNYGWNKERTHSKNTYLQSNKNILESSFYDSANSLQSSKNILKSSSSYDSMNRRISSITTPSSGLCKNVTNTPIPNNDNHMTASRFEPSMQLHESQKVPTSFIREPSVMRNQDIMTTPKVLPCTPKMENTIPSPRLESNTTIDDGSNLTKENTMTTPRIDSNMSESRNVIMTPIGEQKSLPVNKNSTFTPTYGLKITTTTESEICGRENLNNFQSKDNIQNVNTRDFHQSSPAIFGENGDKHKIINNIRTNQMSTETNQMSTPRLRTPQIKYTFKSKTPSTTRMSSASNEIESTIDSLNRDNIVKTPHQDHKNTPRHFHQIENEIPLTSQRNESATSKFHTPLITDITKYVYSKHFSQNLPSETDNSESSVACESGINYHSNNFSSGTENIDGDRETILSNGNNLCLQNVELTNTQNSNSESDVTSKIVTNVQIEKPVQLSNKQPVKEPFVTSESQLFGYSDGKRDTENELSQYQPFRRHEHLIETKEDQFRNQSEVIGDKHENFIETKQDQLINQNEAFKLYELNTIDLKSQPSTFDILKSTNKMITPENRLPNQKSSYSTPGLRILSTNMNSTTCEKNSSITPDQFNDTNTVKCLSDSLKRKRYSKKSSDSRKNYIDRMKFNSRKFNKNNWNEFENLKFTEIISLNKLNMSEINNGKLLKDSNKFIDSTNKTCDIPTRQSLMENSAKTNLSNKPSPETIKHTIDTWTGLVSGRLNQSDAEAGKIHRETPIETDLHANMGEGVRDVMGCRGDDLLTVSKSRHGSVMSLTTFKTYQESQKQQHREKTPETQKPIERNRNPRHTPSNTPNDETEYLRSVHSFSPHCDTTHTDTQEIFDEVMALDERLQKASLKITPPSVTEIGTRISTDTNKGSLSNTRTYTEIEQQNITEYNSRISNTRTNTEIAQENITEYEGSISNMRMHTDKGLQNITEYESHVSNRHTNTDKNQQNISEYRHADFDIVVNEKGFYNKVSHVMQAEVKDSHYIDNPNSAQNDQIHDKSETDSLLMKTHSKINDDCLKNSGAENFHTIEKGGDTEEKTLIKKYDMNDQLSKKALENLNAHQQKVFQSMTEHRQIRRDDLHIVELDGKNDLSMAELNRKNDFNMAKLNKNDANNMRDESNICNTNLNHDLNSVDYRLNNDYQYQREDYQDYKEKYHDESEEIGNKTDNTNTTENTETSEYTTEDTQDSKFTPETENNSENYFSCASVNYHNNSPDIPKDDRVSYFGAQGSMDLNHPESFDLKNDIELSNNDKVFNNPESIGMVCGDAQDIYNSTTRGNNNNNIICSDAKLNTDYKTDDLTVRSSTVYKTDDGITSNVTDSMKNVPEVNSECISNDIQTQREFVSTAVQASVTTCDVALSPIVC